MKRILYLTPLAPLPTTDGGRQRTNLLYQALSRLGEVHTLVLNQTGHPIDDGLREQLTDDYGLIDILSPRRVGQRAPWHLCGAFGEQLAHFVRGWKIDYQPDLEICKRVQPMAQSYDLTVSRYLWAPAVSGVIGGQVPLIVDVDDRESEKVRSAMPNALKPPTVPGKRWWWQRRVEQLAKAERLLLSSSSHIWLTKQQDLQGIEGLNDWSILPNIPFDVVEEASDPSPVTESPTILFVGSLGFAPNRNGVQRFIDASWPKVREAFPGARLVIVGGSAPASWGSIPGVEPLGFVEQLEPHYAEAAFSVVPLWEGAGTKIKVLESLQRSRTVVASDYAVRGYESHLKDGQSLLIADNDAGLAQACVRLLENQAQARQLAEQGRQQVQQHYCRSVFDQCVEQTVQRVLGQLPSENVRSA